MLASLAMLAALAAGVAACGTPDPVVEAGGGEVTLSCTLNGFSNLEQELNDMLGTDKDLPLRKAVEAQYEKFLAQTSHDVDIAFYDLRKKGAIIVHQQFTMEGGNGVFQLKVPASDYKIAVAANMAAVPQVSLRNGEYVEEAALVEEAADKVESHPAPVYAGRGRMLVKDGDQRSGDMSVSMANTMAVLAINRDSCEIINGVRAEFLGLADSFLIVDSSCTFNRNTVVKAEVISLDQYMSQSTDLAPRQSWAQDVFWTKWTRTPVLVCGAGMPSRTVGTEVVGTRVKVWTIVLYVTLEDGSVTRNEIYIGEPLRTGHLLVVKGWLLEDGSFSPNPPFPDLPPGYYFPSDTTDTPDNPPATNDSTIVGVNVMLDWKEGVNYEPEL